MLRLSLATSIILAAGPALAEPPPCAPYETIAANLASKYHEAPVARMVASNGFVVEVLAAADGSTYTILGVRPDMVACVLSVGDGFELVPAALPGSAS